MELNGTSPVMLKEAKTYIWKIWETASLWKSWPVYLIGDSQTLLWGAVICSSGTKTYHHRRKRRSTRGQVACHKVETKHKLAKLAKLVLYRLLSVRWYRKIMKQPETKTVSYVAEVIAVQCFFELVDWYNWDASTRTSKATYRAKLLTWVKIRQ